MDTAASSASPHRLRELIDTNLASRWEFFSIADERWLGWLLEQGYFEPLRVGPESTPIGHGYPESYYLVRMAKAKPARVVDVMMATPLAEDTLNPHTMRAFIEICETLPPNLLSQILRKAREERWVPLMGSAQQWGLSHRRIANRLHKSGRHGDFLLLAEQLLSVRARVDDTGHESSHPLYVTDLSHGTFFNQLGQIDDAHVEPALDLVTKTLANIILTWSPEGRSGTFKHLDFTFAFPTDIFVLEIGSSGFGPPVTDARNLMAVAKTLAERLFCRASGRDRFEALYGRHIDRLPDTVFTWQLRMFVLTLGGETSESQLRRNLFRLFNKRDWNIAVLHPGYLRALHKGFGLLGEESRREFVDRLLETSLDAGQFRQGDLTRVLAAISGHLTGTQRQRARGAGIDASRLPGFDEMIKAVGNGHEKPSARDIDFGKFEVGDIPRLLSEKWDPGKLGQAGYREPAHVVAETVSQRLGIDAQDRPAEYSRHLSLFYDRDRVDANYTYVVLDGIRRSAERNSAALDRLDSAQLVDTLHRIVSENKDGALEAVRSLNFDLTVWWAGSRALHFVSADIMRVLLFGWRDSASDMLGNLREKMLDVVSGLLTYPDPPQSSDPRPSDGHDAHSDSDPYGEAIGSVRGQAFQALVMLANLDHRARRGAGKGFVSGDISKLFEQTLRLETTPALMSMFGNFLNAFHRWDPVWARGLIGDIFPAGGSRRDLHIAAWHGYLLRLPNEDLFWEPGMEKVYRRSLGFADEADPWSKRFEAIDEGLAAHMAHFFLKCDEFGLDNRLFNAFLRRPSPRRHICFVRFVGEHILEGNIPSGSPLRLKLQEVWDLMLSKPHGADVLPEFGRWIFAPSHTFDIDYLLCRTLKTLRATGGKLSWTYGLEKSMAEFARANPSVAGAITERYFFGGAGQDAGDLPRIYPNDSWHTVFGILASREESVEFAEKAASKLAEQNRAPDSLERVFAHEHAH